MHTGSDISGRTLLSDPDARLSSPATRAAEILRAALAAERGRKADPVDSKLQIASVLSAATRSRADCAGEDTSSSKSTQDSPTPRPELHPSEDSPNSSLHVASADPCEVELGEIHIENAMNAQGSSGGSSNSLLEAVCDNCGAYFVDDDCNFCKSCGQPHREKAHSQDAHGACGSTAVPWTEAEEYDSYDDDWHHGGSIWQQTPDPLDVLPDFKIQERWRPVNPMALSMRQKLQCQLALMLNQQLVVAANDPQCPLAHRLHHDGWARLELFMGLVPSSAFGLSFEFLRRAAKCSQLLELDPSGFWIRIRPDSMMQIQGQMQGMPQGMLQVLPQGLLQGMPPGMPQGLPHGMPHGMPPSMPQGMPPGMLQGMMRGMMPGVF